jgi:hypothetical protein
MHRATLCVLHAIDAAAARARARSSAAAWY